MTGPYMKYRTRDRGPFRIMLEPNDDPSGRNQYFEVTFAEGMATKREIIFVRDARVAYNNAVRAHGSRLLNVVNLETGRLVVGGK